jgi:hypothetical protein
MAQPRRLSRPDRPDENRHSKVRLVSASLRTCGDGLHAALRRDGDRIDPGRLIQSAFLDGRPADDPETLLLAWLTLLRPPMSAPSAAAELAQHLEQLPVAPLSPWQHRMISLLHFTASHGRRADPDAPHSSASEKKATP